MKWPCGTKHLLHLGGWARRTRMTIKDDCVFSRALVSHFVIKALLPTYTNPFKWCLTAANIVTAHNRISGARFCVSRTWFNSLDEFAQCYGIGIIIAIFFFLSFVSPSMRSNRKRFFRVPDPPWRQIEWRKKRPKRRWKRSSSELFILILHRIEEIDSDARVVGAMGRRVGTGRLRQRRRQF